MEMTFKDISKGIALGINYLHKSEPPVLHRDLKPGIILSFVNLKIW